MAQNEKLTRHHVIFSNPPIFHLEQSLKFEGCKSEKIDAMGMDIAQPTWLSGCSKKDHLEIKH